MKTKIILIVFVTLAFSFVSCVQQPNQSQPAQITVNASQSIGDGLNLQALGELVKQCKNPQEIEQRLNSDGNINNLDMDGDGQRDYIKVTEFGQGNQRGYSFTDIQPDGEPEIATVNIDLGTQTLVLNGNPQYYGNLNTYQSSFTTTDFLLMAWLMQPHYSYYHSPYYYGHYGYNYRPVPVVSYNVYHSSPYVSQARTKTTYKTVTSTKTTTTNKIKSPNSGNTSKIVANHASLSNPVKSQKSFEARNPSKPIGNGFRSSSSSSNYSKSSTSKPSSSSYSKPSSSYSKPSSSWGSSSSKSWGSSSSRSSSSRSSSSRHK